MSSMLRSAKLTVIETDGRPARTKKAARTVWCQVEPGFWAGSADGEFLGTVERLEDGGFRARGATAERVGEFSTLAQARIAIRTEPGSLGGTHAQDRCATRG